MLSCWAWAQPKLLPEWVKKDEGPLQGASHPSTLIAHIEKDLLGFVILSFFFFSIIFLIKIKALFAGGIF